MRNLHRSLFALGVVALAAGALGGCKSKKNCIDPDGDGFGIGPDCLGPDCTELRADCNFGGSCCQQVDCFDPDGDLHGTGTDCLGPDCTELDPSCHTGACCDAIDCTDADGDNYGDGADCLGPDCNDNDVNCHEGQCCPFVDCTDPDGDDYGVGPDCLGADCNEGNPNCFAGSCCPPGCGEDPDNDGYGIGYCLGLDCHSQDSSCNQLGAACCRVGGEGCTRMLGACGTYSPSCFQTELEQLKPASQLVFDDLHRCMITNSCHSTGVNLRTCATTNCATQIDACFADI